MAGAEKITLYIIKEVIKGCCFTLFECKSFSLPYFTIVNGSGNFMVFKIYR